MNKLFFLPIIISLIIFGCAEQNSNPKTSVKMIDRAWLDSIIKQSDSSYSKPYKRTDFVTAFFYVNKKDSSLCQVMKDSADTIRQVLISKNGTRTFFAQYYANGQLQADLPLDEFGQYHGAATYYYEDGRAQSSGAYMHGLKNGQWNNFDSKGKPLAVENYDKNGQLIP
jgi:hypothetical protein